ncbi:MAG: anthranilate phosphoribosyltransferase [Synechococcus sp.]
MSSASTATPPSWPRLLDGLLDGQRLDAAAAAALMEAWLADGLAPVQTGAFLAALRCRDPDPVELAAMATVLRRAASLPSARPALTLADTCGTGGDGADSFNISTAVAFTTAACGVTIAKHGNRSASGRVGSADVLEALGLDLAAPLPRVLGALEMLGVTFLFAPGWHPALGRLAALRRTLGVRTVFNLLGPLVNPLQPEVQVLGVARPSLLQPMAGALQRLGLQRAVVVHGHGGLDEASLSGPSQLWLLEAGELREERLDPATLGLVTAGPAELAGGDLATNAAILQAVLEGHGTAAQTDAVRLNTALVLWAAGAVSDWRSGVDLAGDCLAAGAPWQRFGALADWLRSPEG